MNYRPFNLLGLDRAPRTPTLAQMTPLLQTDPQPDANIPDGYKWHRAQPLRAPVIFASPHSGQHYPASLQESICVPLIDLRRTEDAFVDHLFQDCLTLGAHLLTGVYARSYVDLNRDPRELDETMFEGAAPRTSGRPNVRVKAGLGCLPRIGASGKGIYQTPLTHEEGRFRLDHVHDGYHDILKREIGRLQSDWSDITIIDCHSMPSKQPGRASLPDIVLGDRYGSSCSPFLMSHVERACRKLGWSVARNAPYAGGYTTRRYGRPKRGVHVLQIEINRQLYLDEIDVAPGPQFEKVRAQLGQIIQAVIDFALKENA